MVGQSRALRAPVPHNFVMDDVTACDVVVVGAGPAGAATAAALCAAGVGRVVLVDLGRARPAVGESIPPQTRLLLDRLGAWTAFVADGHAPSLGNASAWGSDRLGYNDFIANPHGSGWHLDRARFDALLVDHAVAAGATLVRPARVRSAEARSAGGFVLVAGDHRLTARFVVDATGPGAALARMLGASRRVVHRLTCAVGILRLGEDPPLTRLTLLEAAEYGWWYAARVPGDRAAVLVATDPPLLAARALHTPGGWADHLARTRHLAPAVAGAVLEAGGVRVRSAPSTVIDPVVGDGWMAVGDAAGAFDPLSSQGIHKAVADGLDAGGAIVAWFQGRGDSLDRYAAAVAARFEQYERTRASFYGLERRWPDAPFWRARQVAAGSVTTRRAP